MSNSINLLLFISFIFASSALMKDPASGPQWLLISVSAGILLLKNVKIKNLLRLMALGVAAVSALATLQWIPGRPPFECAATQFLALAIAIGRGRDESAHRASRQMLFTIPALVLLIFLLLNLLYHGEVEASWSNSTSLFMLSLSILFYPPLQWPVSALAAPYPSQRLARISLACCTFVPVALGLIFFYNLENPLFSLETSVATFVFALVVLFATIVCIGAGWSFKINLARELAFQRLEESWRNREAYFRNLVDNSSVILYMSGPNGACTFLSRKWQDYTGRPPIGDLEFGWLDCVHPEDRTRMSARARARSSDHFQPYSSEFRLRRWDGKYRWVVSTGLPRFDDQRRFIGYMGNVIDVHDRKIQADSLKKEKLDAELSNQTKSQFLANMSHEIRTPLNAILGFADLCEDLTFDQATRLNFLKRIRWNGDHLLRLIDEILDLAKMESGARLVQRSQFSVDRVIDQTIDSLRALASQKGLYLRVVKTKDPLPKVYSDPHRIKQIVNNLVGNAIKFTNEGGVTVKMYRRVDEIVLEVADTGIGIPLEQVPNLFKPFSQGDSSVTRTFGGTGLGLHLSKKLAQSIEGDIQLSSSGQGKGGSTFEFHFAIGESASPIVEITTRTPSPEPQKAPDVKLFGRKILVAEDSPDSRDLLQIYFRPTGAQLVFAEDGYQAVEKAWKERPDLILMDVQMPGLDGLEATRQLRSDGFKNPIIALTAHALQDEVDRSFEAGCSFHLTKPISRATLLTLAGEVLQPAVQNHMQL